MTLFHQLFFVILLQGTVLSANSQNYVGSWPEKYSDTLLIREWICQKELLNSGCKSDYLNSAFTKIMQKDQVSLILEIGSRDAIDALCLSEYFKARIYSFECNPEAISICKHNIGKNPNITLVPLAVWNETTSLTFYPVISEGQGENVGLSSLLKILPDETSPDTSKQTEVVVQATRIDEWMEKERIESADLICIDVQGGTLQVLQGLGKKLANTKYIIAEVENRKYYVGQSLYPEVETFLFSQGFTPVARLVHDGIYEDVSDVLFIRNDLKPLQLGN